MNKRQLLVLALMVLLALGGALLAAACGESEGSSAFGQAETTLTVTITPQSTAAPTATQEPVPTDPPAPTATPQPPAPTATYTPKPTCPPRTYNHVNIDLLRLQPGMTGAVITEIDDNKIRIVLQGVEFDITGRGTLVGFGGRGDPSDELFEQVVGAIDAVRYQC